MYTALANASALALPLPDNVVHCVVTSPPYWALRDYKVGADQGELGSEPCADCLGWATGDPCRSCHVCNLVSVFREVRRVLHPSGTVWLNYGDMYAQTAPRGRYGDQGDLSTGSHGELGPRRDLSKLPRGVKKGDRMLMHARLALALQADGWWVRSAPIWRKTNALPQPAQVYRRPVDSYEMVYMLIKDYRRYFYDAEAVREESAPSSLARAKYNDGDPSPKNLRAVEEGIYGGPMSMRKAYGQSRHMRDVLTIPTQGWKGAHFATFPERLVIPLISASTSEYGVCSRCKAQYKRIVKRGAPVNRPDNPNAAMPYTADSGHGHGTGKTTLHKIVSVETTGWEPTCKCDADIESALVFDPFAGSGTVCKVARDLGRSSFGIDISHKYLSVEARSRLVSVNRSRPKLRPKKKKDAPITDLPLFSKGE